MGYFPEGHLEDLRIQPHGVEVDLTVGQGHGRRLTVGDHDDLPHVLLLAGEEPARQLQPVRGIGVVGAHLGCRQRRQRDLLGRVVEQHHLERIAGELGLDQVSERQRHFLGRGEAVLPVEDHRVGAVQQQHRGAGGAVLRLLDHEIAVFQVDRHPDPFPGQGVPQGRGHVQVEGIAELVGLAGPLDLDPGGEIAGLMGAQAGFADAA